MRMIRYVTLYETIEEDGQIYDVPLLTDVTLPIILNPHKISSIEPYCTPRGKPYKNVSLISYDTGEKFKVVGNYKNIEYNKYRVNNNPIGFNINNAEQRKETIKERAEVKSTIKRGTKGSNKEVL